MTTFTPQQVTAISLLANIPLKDEEVTSLSQGFTKTLEVVDKLQQVNVASIEPAHHVTGLENVWREDGVDEERMFTQAQALANAPQTYKGFFVVNQIIEQE